MATLAPAYITPEEYLERERQAETKSKYLRRGVFAMAGGTLRHARIITSLVRRLADGLSQGPCDVYSTDIRLAITQAGLYTYPDVMVVCGEPASVDDRQDTISNPVLIVEVLSESTKDYDRGQNFQYYRCLPSLMEYLTVAQDEAHVEQYTRQPSGQWLLSDYSDTGAKVHLPSLQIDLRIADIYEKVQFAS